MEDNEKIALINEVKDLRTIKGLQEKIIEQDIEIKKLKEENEKLKKLQNALQPPKDTKNIKKTLTPIELKEENDKQLQLRREANKKIVDEAPDDEYPNEQEKLRHLQWLNDLAKAELETDSDSDDTKDSLDYSSEEEEKPKPKPRIVKKKVYSDSDSD